MADKRTVDTALIFVYGGLMRGFDLHHYMAGAIFVSDGWVSGELVALGRYPGLLDGNGRVSGEIYRLDDVAANLEALDDLEEFDPADPEKSQYVRVARDVVDREGTLVRAWVYLYNGDVSEAPVVKSGDWRRHESAN